MRLPTYCLLGGLAILLAVGCSYRGKCQTSRFENDASCCQYCEESHPPSALQRLRTIQWQASDSDLQFQQQGRPAVHVAKANADSHLAAISEPQLGNSQTSKPNYEIAEVVPYENTQLRIPPAKPMLSSSKSSRLPVPLRAIEKQIAKKETDACRAEVPSDREPEKNLAGPFAPVEASQQSDITNDIAPDPIASNEAASDNIVPAADQLTASSKNVFDSSDAITAEATDGLTMAGVEQDSVSESAAVILTVPATAGKAEPTPTAPPGGVIVGRVEQPIVLRARPHYRSTFIEEITRKTAQRNISESQLIPATTAGRGFAMDPVDFRSLPAIQSTDHEVILPAQKNALNTETPRSSRNTPDSMPNMVPIVKQHHMSQHSLSQQTLPATKRQPVPTIQASSKKILQAFPQRDRATRLLNKSSVASPLLNNPTDVLRLRATTGLSSEQQFPPIIRFNTQASGDMRSLEASQIDVNKPNKIKLLPPNVDESNLPSFENAPMIDHSRVNEAIRRLTVRPDLENGPTAETIDR